MWHSSKLPAQEGWKRRLLNKMHQVITPANYDECEFHRAPVCLIAPACPTMCLQSDLHWKVPLRHQWRGVRPRGAGNGSMWLAEAEARLLCTFAVLLLLGHVFVCLHLGTVSFFLIFLSFFTPPAVLLFPQYLFISVAHRDVWKGRDDVGRKRVEKKAWDVNWRVWSWMLWNGFWNTCDDWKVGAWKADLTVGN